MTVLLRSHAHVPVGSADVLPRLAAVAWPHRAALRAGARTTTFAELDDTVSRLAFGLRQLIGGDGLPVVVSAALGLDFPAAFYAVLRSGNVVVPVNPRMPAETFAGVLAESGARAAVLGRVTYERVRPVLAGARLEQVVLHDAPAVAGQLTCAELATRGSLLVEPRDRDEHATAILDGRRTRAHHELKAAALARAEVLGADSVVLNATSAYQPADLGAGLAAGATQVLLGNPDPAAARREAARVGATHVWRDGDARLAVAS
ncbi:MAG TPA: AMP-binding protein [Actinophytocola sp.]|nr:AMP-binding protein [Actinophytocola sp.]